MYALAQYIAKYLFFIFGGGIKVHHKVNIPKDHKGFVVVCTHTTWLDVLALGIALYPIQIHYMAKKQLFANKISKWFLSSLNAFPVDRDNPGPSSLKVPRNLLKEAKVVGLFPSGTRSTTDLKRGAVVIANRSNVPIVPAVYKGPLTLMQLLKRTKARIILGEPIDIKENDNHEAILKQLQVTFSELEKPRDL